jgi:hypothetical protein
MDRDALQWINGLAEQTLQQTAVAILVFRASMSLQAAPVT